jgi:hypothetical protein
MKLSGRMVTPKGVIEGSLTIEDGRIAIDSLFKPGFAHRVDPDWRNVQPLVRAPAMV